LRLEIEAVVVDAEEAATGVVAVIHRAGILIVAVDRIADALVVHATLVLGAEVGVDAVSVDLAAGGGERAVRAVEALAVRTVAGVEGTAEVIVAVLRRARNAAAVRADVVLGAVVAVAAGAGVVHELTVAGR